jgi:hypothetical protein
MEWVSSLIFCSISKVPRNSVWMHSNHDRPPSDNPSNAQERDLPRHKGSKRIYEEGVHLFHIPRGILYKYNAKAEEDVFG